MGSIFQTTLNTRALPTGDMRYVRSDYPGNLTDEEVHWLLQKDITTIVDLREAKEYEARPCRLETEEEFDYYHMPVTGGGDTPESPEAVARTYLSMLDGQMDQFGTFSIYQVLPEIIELWGLKGADTGGE